MAAVQFKQLCLCMVLLYIIFYIHEKKMRTQLQLFGTTNINWYLTNTTITTMGIHRNFSRRGIIFPALKGPNVLQKNPPRNSPHMII